MARRLTRKRGTMNYDNKDEDLVELFNKEIAINTKRTRSSKQLLEAEKEKENDEAKSSTTMITRSRTASGVKNNKQKEESMEQELGKVKLQSVHEALEEARKKRNDNACRWIDGEMLSCKYKDILQMTSNSTPLTSYNSQQQLEVLVSEMLSPSSGAFSRDSLAFTFVNYLRHSLDNSYLPPVDVLSKFIHGIAIPYKKSLFDVSEAFFGCLHTLLRLYPPAHANSRFYWLKVFRIPEPASDTKKPPSRVKNLDDAITLQKLSIESFRQVARTVFTGECPNPFLLSFLFELIEVDLLVMQRAHAAKTADDSVEECSSQGARRRRAIEARTLDSMTSIPMSYMILYDVTETRKRALDEAAKSFVLKLVDYLLEARKEHRLITTNTVLQFVWLCFETMRWFCSEVVNYTPQEISFELKSDFVDVVEKLVKSGVFTLNDLKATMPAVWMIKTAE